MNHRKYQAVFTFDWTEGVLLQVLTSESRFSVFNGLKTSAVLAPSTLQKIDTCHFFLKSKFPVRIEGVKFGQKFF